MPKLRRLEVGDIDQLKPLFEILTTDVAPIDEKSLLNNDHLTCLVLTEDEKIVGFGSLVTYTIASKGELARIEDVIIAENYQGKGLGKILTLELIKIAKEKKVHKIFITSNPMRIAAHKLYTSVGFIKGNTDSFYLNI